MPNDNDAQRHPPHTYEQLLVGWIVGAAWLEHQARRDEKDETAPQHPPPTTVSLCSQGGSGANGPVTPPRQRRAPSTHSHAYELLLAGWIVGADGNGDDWGGGRGPRRPEETAPPTAAASNCSQGGYGVLSVTMTRGPHCLRVVVFLLWLFFVSSMKEYM
jgi:hypothetical protein